MNNAFQDWNTALKKLKTTASQLVVSSCCRSGLRVETGKPYGTQYYTCVSCDKPCDVIPLQTLNSPVSPTAETTDSVINIASNPITIAENVMPITPQLTEKESASLERFLTGEPPYKMPVIYISGAYRSKWGFLGVAFNIWKARRVAVRLWKESGMAVICPHLNSAFMLDGIKAETFLKGDLEIIKRLRIKRDCIYMMKGYRQSEGSLRELALAKRRRLKVLYE